MSWDTFSERTPCRNKGLKVQERIFWINPGYLAEFSPVFEAMFFGDFSESKEEIILLPRKDANEILKLLRCLFRTGTEIKKVTIHNIGILAKLADEYQIDYLIKKCKKLLTTIEKVDIEIENVDVLMKLADKFELEDLMEECKNFVRRETPRLWKERMVLWGPDEINENYEQELVKLFIIGVRYKLKDIVRDLFPEIRRDHVKELEPFLDELPSEIRNAISTPIPEADNSDEEHEVDDAGSQEYCSQFISTKKNFFMCSKKAYYGCTFCNWALCEKHYYEADDEHRDESHKNHDDDDGSDAEDSECSQCYRFYGCRGCKNCFNRNPRNDKREYHCYCINPLAIAELEKIGV